MQIVVPMAGIGKRFLDRGYTEPKPLIQVHGKPMIQSVVELFPGEESFVFICNDRHLKETPLREVLLRLKPQAKIVSITNYEQGPVANILLSSSAISDGDPVIVSYCDFDMGWDYEAFKRLVQEKNIDSASVCYQGFHPHLFGPNLYAGVRTDENGYALEVREKHSFTENKMDTWQQTGVFYFKSGALLKKYAQIARDADEHLNGEYYVSHMFNALIGDGLNSLVYPIDHFCQWGTPEDLKSYNDWMRIIQEENTHTRPEKAQRAAEVLRDRGVVASDDDGSKILSYWETFVRARKDSSPK